MVYIQFTSTHFFFHMSVIQITWAILIPPMPSLWLLESMAATAPVKVNPVWPVAFGDGQLSENCEKKTWKITSNLFSLEPHGHSCDWKSDAMRDVSDLLTFPSTTSKKDVISQHFSWCLKANSARPVWAEIATFFHQILFASGSLLHQILICLQHLPRLDDPGGA